MPTGHLLEGKLVASVFWRLFLGGCLDAYDMVFKIDAHCSTSESVRLQLFFNNGQKLRVLDNDPAFYGLRVDASPKTWIDVQKWDILGGSEDPEKSCGLL